MDVFVLALSMVIGLPLIMAWIAWEDDRSGSGPGRPAHQ
jgi:hypothetical protein